MNWEAAVGLEVVLLEVEGAVTDAVVEEAVREEEQDLGHLDLGLP